VRTVVTFVAYVASLVRRVPRTDVVHVFSPSYWAFLLGPAPAILVARAFGRRVLLNYHSGEADDHLTRWGWHAIPIMRLASEIVVPSQYLVDVFARHGLEATAVFNHLDVEQFPFRERRALEPRFLSNRNFESHYNVACVLRAFARVQQRRPDAQLVVAGDGSQRNALHALAAELGLRNVEFTGPVAPDRMPSLYDAADVYLNASSIDNMPLSILEAFATGVPVVTTDAGGIPYIVRHEENGLLVPCDDDAALAAAALRLLDDSELAASLSARARAECVAKYTWSAVRHEWEACYAGTVLPGAQVA
jgi:glycosyltransferase involved in cell wall biosynthesis